MKKRLHSPTFIEWGVIVFGLWQARDIIEAWQTSPKDWGGGYLFLLWLVPLVIHGTHDQWVSKEHSKRRFQLVLIALSGILIGSLGKLNALCYIGLVVALGAGALESNIRGKYYWVICSFVWMPIFGYFMGFLPNQALFSLKLILLIGGTLPLLYQNFKK